MVPPPQVCVSTLVTVSTMMVVDLYLLEQSMMGAKWKAGPAVWPSVAVLLGDLCFLLALRFVSAGVASEARSPRRGFANALWFLFLSLLQLKLFFICQNYRQERRPPDPLARKTLTLLLSVCLPSLFLVLTGADHMTPLRRKQEARSRLLWVVVDLLDVLDLQAGLWETHGDVKGPLWLEGLMFFYCYVLLLLLPCVSLTELGSTAAPGAEHGTRRGAVYPWLSLITVNILTLFLRGAGVLWYRDPRVSTVFLGKNLLAMAVKLSSVWEKRKQRSAGEAAGPGYRSTHLGAGPERLECRGHVHAHLAPTSTQCNTLSRAHSHTASLSCSHAEPTDASLGTSFISHEL
ncbi:transmembrane protein 121 [Scleropages formosus]|uniref:Transmembrane protein 265 n=1 Tax=Scleropages formosus TaxID=113540 RepID=A0A8C9RA13_SCLFO|nr:transmembrane protein 121-like [Scleropages formosus]